LLIVSRMHRLAALPVALLFGCSGTPATQAKALVGPEVGECGPTEYHALGIFTASGPGPVVIEVARPGKHVLALSAHDATSWQITTSNGAEIEKVYAVGYGAQTVDVSQAAGKPEVHTDSEDTTGAYGCGYTWPYDGDGCDTGNMLRLSAARVQHDFNSYDGCKTTGSFMLDEHMHVYSDCTTSYDVLPKNHFIVDCDGGTEGSCGYEGSGSNGEGGGGGGGSDGSGGVLQ
jgi:hypothetical protein